MMIDFNRGDAVVLVTLLIALWIFSSVFFAFLLYKVHSIYRAAPKNFIKAMNDFAGYYIVFILTCLIILATFSGYNIIRYFTS